MKRHELNELDATELFELAMGPGVSFEMLGRSAEAISDAELASTTLAGPNEELTRCRETLFEKMLSHPGVHGTPREERLLGWLARHIAATIMKKASLVAVTANLSDIEKSVREIRQLSRSEHFPRLADSHREAAAKMVESLETRMVLWHIDHRTIKGTFFRLAWLYGACKRKLRK